MNWRDLEEKLKDYVTIDRFTPVEKLVYGGSALILAGVITYALSLLLKK